MNQKIVVNKIFKEKKCGNFTFSRMLIAPEMNIEMKNRINLFATFVACLTNQMIQSSGSRKMMIEMLSDTNLIAKLHM